MAEDSNDRFQPGGFWRIDDRTGFRVRARDTREEWNGAIVDKDDWEPRHPQEFIRGRSDRQNVPKPRPEPPPNFVGPATTVVASTAAAGSTTVEVTSTAGFAAGLYILIVLDTLDSFRVQIVGIPDSTHFTLGTALPWSTSEGLGIVSYGGTTSTGRTVNEVFYVATTGDDANAGTLAAPFLTIQHAVNVMIPGDTTYVRGGTYNLTAPIGIVLQQGYEGLPFRLYAYTAESPIIDGAGMPHVEGFGGNCIYLQTSTYWHIRGFEIRNGYCGGVRVVRGSNHNTLELLVVHNSGLHAVQNSNGITIDGHPSWAGLGGYNTILNCDSYLNNNVGGGGGDADGFGIDGSAGPGNVVEGCRAWNNADDGFDCFNEATAADNLLNYGVVLTGCWSKGNGLGGGDGNGFKLGGQRPGTTQGSGGHTVTNCVAWANYDDGFDDNAATHPNTLTYCTAYGNSTASGGAHNFHCTGAGTAHIIRDCISLVGDETLDAAVVHNHNSWDLAVTCNAADFVTLDDTGFDGARQADGSLPDLHFLHLATGSDLLGVGVNINGGGTDLGAFQGADGASAWASYSAEFLAILDVMTTTPSFDLADAMDGLIAALKAATIWTNLDGLWVVRTPLAAYALINWINPTGLRASPGASAVFTANVGYTLSDVSGHNFDTGFDPAAGTNFQRNSNSWGASFTDTAAQSYRSIEYGSNIYLYSRWTDNHSYSKVNSTHEDDNGIPADGGGLWTVVRTGAGATVVYRNGVSLFAGTSASIAIPAGDLNLQRSFEMTYAGGALTPTQVTALNTAWAAYKAAWP